MFGGLGSVVVVLVVIVVRWRRRGRRKVGGSVETGMDGWHSALLILCANMLAAKHCRCIFLKDTEGGIE